MPRTASSSPRKEIRQLLGQFADKIAAVVERAAPKPNGGADDVRARILAALGIGAKRGPGRPKGAKNSTVKPVAKAAKARPKRKQTAAQRRANKLQGQYMGTIRLLPAAAKSKVRAVRAEQGVEAAIKMAQTMKKVA